MSLQFQSLLILKSSMFRVFDFGIFNFGSPWFWILLFCRSLPFGVFDFGDDFIIFCIRCTVQLTLLEYYWVYFWGFLLVNAYFHHLWHCWKCHFCQKNVLNSMYAMYSLPESEAPLGKMATKMTIAVAHCIQMRSLLIFIFCLFCHSLNIFCSLSNFPLKTFTHDWWCLNFTN